MTSRSSDHLAKLRALAQAMTQPGPWTIRKAEGFTPAEYTLVDGNGMWLADLGASPSRDAAYLAAVSPGVILALCDEVERLRAFETMTAHEALDKIDQLRVALNEACDIASEHIFAPTASIPLAQATQWGTASGIQIVDTGKPYRDKERIAALRKIGQ